MAWSTISEKVGDYGYNWPCGVVEDILTKTVHAVDLRCIAFTEMKPTWEPKVK